MVENDLFFVNSSSMTALYADTRLDEILINPNRALKKFHNPRTVRKNLCTIKAKENDPLCGSQPIVITLYVQKT